MTSRGWCFTLNNYTNAELCQLDEDLGVRYLIYGLEKAPTTGTPHLQGYIEVDRPVRMSYLKKLPGLQRAAMFMRRGTRDQARAYCQKEGEWVEFGDWHAGGQGARTELRELMEAVKREPTKVLEHMESNPECYSRHQRFIEKYTTVLEKETTREFRKVEVTVLHGDAGTGKTRAAFEADPNLFTVNADDSFPFDGYNGESTILIDDFYGGLKYHHLLRILDGHQLRVNVKGGSRYAKWTKVFITSNAEPKDWYQKGLTPALQRRLTTVTRMCHEVGEVILDSPTTPLDWLEKI